MGLKVYTRTGDKGDTGLADGSRIAKDDVRIESYGTLDELNSVVGLSRQFLSDLPEPSRTELDHWLCAIQNDLFNLGADLATPLAKRYARMIILDEVDVKKLEEIVDHCQNVLPPLRHFVLPGGSTLNASLHLARTLCRRAERDVVKLARREEINPLALPYINRLSDLFFILARWAVHISQKTEVAWDAKMGVRHLPNLTTPKK